MWHIYIYVRQTVVALLHATMASILDSISSLVTSGSVAQESALTPSLQTTDTLVVWSNSPLTEDHIILNEFREAVKRRGAKFYTCSHILSYQDFCISVLCARGYSLNHKVTPLIPQRAYLAAWRAIDAVSIVGPSRVQEWLSQQTKGRTSFGYSTAHGLDTEENTNAVMQTSGTHTDSIMSESIGTGTVVSILSSDEGIMSERDRIYPTARSAMLALWIDHITRHT